MTTHQPADAAPATRVCLNIGYERFIFDSAVSAAKVIDLLNSAINVTHDWDRPAREDCAKQYHLATGTDIGIEVRPCIINASNYVAPDAE